MDSRTKPDGNLRLVNRLAVVTQVHLPGTAGRLAQQIRDLEAAAPAFGEAGLVRNVDRPVPLNVHAAGIATDSPGRARVMGGYLYAAGAVRLDLLVQDNCVSTGTQNATCEVDDIDHADQSKRLALIGIRQAYSLADAAMRDGERRDLLIMDTPLLLSRAMSAPKEDAAHAGHRLAYDAALEAVELFWANHQSRLYPWDESGPILVSVGSGRYDAILQLAGRDIRAEAGREFVLPGEAIHSAAMERVQRMEQAVLSIGHKRFMQGLLGAYTRTAAYRMDIQSPRMEPDILAKAGVVGFHFKGAAGTSTKFAQMLGEPELWTQAGIDRLAGLLMAMSAIGGREAEPLPLLLARRELAPLVPFIKNYAMMVREHLRTGKLESVYLDNLDSLD